MIFHSDRTIFFHSGKTAGTAIEEAFGYTNKTHSPYDLNLDVFKGWDHVGHVYLQHATPRYMKPCVDPEVWRRYFKFTVVRNPYDRLVSVYYFQYKSYQPRFGDFDGFVHALPNLLRAEAAHNGQHYVPQYEYAHIGDERVVDMVLAFESVDADFAKLCTRVGRHMTLTRTNTATHPRRPPCSAAEIYSKASVRIMQDVYRRDFECFGYALEPPETPWCQRH